MRKPQGFVWLVFILLSFIWGSSFILMKRALVHFDFWQVASLRLTAAMAVLLPVAICRLGQIERRQLRFIAISGLCGMFLPAFLFAAGQKQLNSGTVGVLNALTPLVTFLIGIWFFNKGFRMAMAFPLLLGFVGTCILIVSGNDGGLSLNPAVFLVVLGTFGYGVNTNLIKTYIPDMDSMTLSSVSVCFVGILACAIFFGCTDWQGIAWKEEGVKRSLYAVVVLGVLGTGLAQVLFNSVLRMSSAVMASSVTYLMPVIAVIWGLLDRESFSSTHVVGMLIIFGSVCWMGWTSSKETEYRR